MNTGRSVRNPRLRPNAGAVSTITIMLLLASVGGGHSATNTVTSLADSGPGSLRQVMANSAAGDSIVFGVTGMITLASGELIVSNDLSIMGPGASFLAINGAGASRAFNVSSNVSALISSLTLTNGRAVGNGGAVYSLGTLSLDHLIVSGNSTVDGTNGALGQGGGQGGCGGGLWNAGSCFANRCGFSGNHTGAGGMGGGAPYYDPYSPGGGGQGGDGGGIFNASQMFLTNCTMSDNYCGRGGNGGGGSLSGAGGGSGGRGAGVCSMGSLVLIGSTIAYNRTGWGGGGGSTGIGMPGNGGYGGEGGGIYAAGFLVLTNCTLAGNSCGNGGAAGGGWGPPGGSGGSGGGICYYAYATQVVVVACTIVSNATGGGWGGGPSGSGGGIYAHQSDAGYCFLEDLVALNCATNAGAGPDVYGTFNSLGHNLIGTTNGSSGFNAPGDLTGSQASPLDPKLGPLADNGGPTLTMALLPGSPAIDAGGNLAAPPTDQRGFPRPFGAAADIGAYELCYPALLHLSAAQGGAITIRAYGSNGQPCHLLSSPDLSNWVPVATNQIGSDGTVLFYDTLAPGSACRFYRLVMP